MSVEATEVYENAREAVRKFIGAEKSNEIIFTRNTTESLNLVAYSYGLSNVKKGDEIVVSIMEHHSDLCLGKWWLKPAVPSLNSSNVPRMAASTLKR